ncbi:MAG: CoA pyrophosphatase [Kordiimonadaceae bacterium]|nr:CoA pyrophosphatase [Kordiimonadaceae bacterium]
MRSWLEQALKEGNPAARGTRSDYDLNLNVKLADLKGQKMRPAAVLVPIVDHADGATVLLTKRTDHLSKHPGQISFPGGAVDPVDVDSVAAELRETEEEIGLDRSFVDVAGFLDEYLTGTGFEIKPVVGLVKPGFTLELEEQEVAEAFEVPLDFLLDRRNHAKESAMWQGVERHYYAMPYNGYRIWGATAAMLVNLCDVMEAAKVPR